MNFEQKYSNFKQSTIETTIDHNLMCGRGWAREIQASNIYSWPQSGIDMAYETLAFNLYFRWRFYKTKKSTPVHKLLGFLCVQDSTIFYQYKNRKTLLITAKALKGEYFTQKLSSMKHTYAYFFPVFSHHLGFKNLCNILEFLDFFARNYLLYNFLNVDSIFSFVTIWC